MFVSPSQQTQNDGAIARDDHYRHAHPGPDDVLLLVEVAHTSQRYDRGIKAPLYARYGIRETWVADVARLTLEVFRDPSPEGYRHHERLQPGETVAPEAFPQQSIEVEEIVGSG